MLDIRLIRSDPDAVRSALARRGDVADDAIDRVLELDGRWRGLTTELEELRAEQNKASKGRRGAPTPEEREAMAGLAVRERALSGTGMLPDTEQQIYRLPEDDLYLVGTSEVALASLHRDEILDASDFAPRGARLSPPLSPS